VLFLSIFATAQQRAPHFLSDDVHQVGFFIENKGQYDHLQSHIQDADFGVDRDMGKVLVKDGNISFMTYKREKRADYEELERREKELRKQAREQGIKMPKHDKAEEEREMYQYTKDWIDLVWIGANKNADIIYGTKSKHYFSYGQYNYCYGYKTVTYKDLYPNIDVVYELHPKHGIKYSLVVRPGGDINQVKYKYEGTNVKVRKNKEGLRITDKIEGLQESELVAFYEGNNKQQVPFEYQVEENVVSFKTTQVLDASKTLVIDPWVTNMTTLLSTGGYPNNIGIFVDFDNAGNLFVYGAMNNCVVAKYDPNGVLLWTFLGTVVTPAWSSCPTGYMGDFVVEKSTGRMYLGQGFNPSTGAVVVRIDAAGNYDNFITTPSSLLYEFWEMVFNCATGELIGMGGSTGSNLCVGVIDTVAATTNGINFTGIATFQQDIVNAVIDDSGNVYTTMASVAAANVDNHIQKTNSSYTTMYWNQPSGYTTLNESDNMPIMGFGAVTNGTNCLAVNSSYLFYWDGKNLKAFDKITGLGVGTPLTLAGYTDLMSSGIFANNCNEIFIGGNNGDILKYSFNGTTFTALPSIVIPGKSGLHIHDIKYNPINDLLYVAADSFVATVLTNSACLPPASGQINLGSTVICPSDGVVQVTNPQNSPYTFVWYDTNTQTIVQNTTVPVGVVADTFFNMDPNAVYLVTVIQPTNCQVISNFIFVAGICNGDPVYLCPGESYTLTTGQVVSQPGVYTDTLTNQFGLDSVVTINIILATDTITQNRSICLGDTYILPNGGGVQVAGTYYNSFINAEGCDSTIITNLTIRPVQVISQNVDICLGTTYVLPGGGVVGAAGTYGDTFVNAAGCDSIRITILNTINPPPYTVMPDTVHCEPGAPFTLYASGGTSITWTSSAGPVNCPFCYSQTVQPINSINYYMQIQNNIGCAAYDTVRVQISPLNTSLTVPNADTALCEGQNMAWLATVTGGVAAVTWQMFFGDGTPAFNNIIGGIHKYTDPGYYTAMLVGTSALGCTDTVTKLIHVYPKNASTFDITDNSLCIGDPVLISAQIGAGVDSFYFTFGDGNSVGDIINPTYTYPNAGTYTITFTAQNAECPDSITTQQVVVSNYPAVNLGPDTAYCDGYSIPIQLSNQAPTAGSYLWSTGSTASTISVATPGTYFLTVSNVDCYGSDTVRVLEDCYLNVPNSFTPNNDNLNDYFNPMEQMSRGVTNYTMRIYNRWGETVFETTNINGRGWDGMFGNKAQPMGVYVYQIDATFKNGKKQNFTGNVTLLR
jgi:gliding motility-associated-like protein